jgi:hypothetical protein
MQSSLEQAATLRDWFLPDQPGHLVGLHILNSGDGSCWIDRWLNPTSADFEHLESGSLKPGV